MKNSKPVLVTYQSGSTRTFKSQDAVSRSLTGTGSVSLRSTVSRRVAQGGGYIGSVYIQAA